MSDETKEALAKALVIDALLSALRAPAAEPVQQDAEWVREYERLKEEVQESSYGMTRHCWLSHGRRGECEPCRRFDKAEAALDAHVLSRPASREPAREPDAEWVRKFDLLARKLEDDARYGERAEADMAMQHLRTHVLSRAESREPDTDTPGKRVQCSECGRWWPSDSEQAAAVRTVGECIVCNTAREIAPPTDAREDAAARHSGEVNDG